MTTAAVITCSDTSAREPSRNQSGPLAAELLAAHHFDVVHQAAVPDDADGIRGAVEQQLAAGCRVVVCTGGTGLGPRDVTPEAVAALGGRAVPGIGEAMRAASRGRVPTADLSRAGAVAVGRAVVLMLPGSPGGVRDGLGVAAPLLSHALAMLDGGGHGHSGDSSVPSATPAGPAHAAAGGSSPGPPPGAEPRLAEAEREVTGEPEGGDGRVALARVGPEPIDAGALAESVRRQAAGAVVTFEGRVRDHDHDRPVTQLTYEAHPDAEAVLAGIVAEARSRPQVHAAATAHRTGPLRIGDLAFFVAVASPHRRQAFETCAWLVDEAKTRTPIWKHQVFADGTSEWVNCP